MSSPTDASWLEPLRDPTLYGPGVETVELIETHISWVLLAGDSVYKLKKPVDLGFVDFTTLEKRKFYCEEELRLNRRLAPNLYQAVVSLTGTPAAPKWNGTGEPFDYAVRMRRFPANELLPEVLRRGELEERHLDQLAADLARFHGTVAVAGEESPLGTAERTLDPPRANFKALLGSENPPELTARLETLRDWTEQEFIARHADLADRKRDGFIRECHGDLHLGNMFLEGDRITMFDCIEFSERLRWIDVISEVAFLVMDLRDRGRPDLGRRFLNAYLEQTGDYAGMNVFRFYIVYRALVRAKVQRLRQIQGGLSAAESADLDRKLAGYVDLAEQFSRPAPRALIITSGLSGSGKSLQTRSLITELGAIRVRSDVERKRLHGYAALDQTRSAVGGDIYSPAASEQTYARLRILAGELLRAGETALIDATFLKRAHRNSFLALAEERGVPFLMLEFDAAPDVLRARVRERSAAGNDPSEADLAVLEQQLATREPLTPEEAAAAIRINETRPLEIDEIRRRLR